VVAEEIRKLATNSNQSVEKISSILNGIQADSKLTYSQIRHVEEGITQVADAIVHMANAAQQLSETAYQLDRTADSL